MLRHDSNKVAMLKKLEQAYQEALRYSLRYHSRWDRLDEAAARLREFVQEQEIAQTKAA